MRNRVTNGVSRIEEKSDRRRCPGRCRPPDPQDPYIGQTIRSGAGGINVERVVREPRRHAACGLTRLTACSTTSSIPRGRRTAARSDSGSSPHQPCPLRTLERPRISLCARRHRGPAAGMTRIPGGTRGNRLRLLFASSRQPLGVPDDLYATMRRTSPSAWAQARGSHGDAQPGELEAVLRSMLHRLQPHDPIRRFPE